jgi:anti-sigma regulatory factor (Ser/Thr protein kinase)
MQTGGQRVIEISSSADIPRSCREADAMARRLGFDDKAAGEIVLTTSELASNLVKHAGRGRLMLTPLRETGRAGIQIEALDDGPGIADVNQAITDGFSTAGSLGYGLGAVNRLMDELSITSPLEGARGTHIVCKRWRIVEPPGVALCPFEFGVATRAHPLEAVNGDAYILEKGSERALVGVVDGLGHGPRACEAAQTASRYVKAHYEQPLESIFCGADRACRGTNGVVMALARIDWAGGRLTLASVGNVECRVFRSAQPFRFIVRRGVVGLNGSSPAISEHPWSADKIMVLHSDGVQSRWRWEDFAHLDALPANALAEQLLHRLARDDDDATVVVVKAAAGKARRPELCKNLTLGAAALRTG